MREKREAERYEIKQAERGEKDSGTHAEKENIKGIW